MRRLLVSSFLAEVTQQIHSLRARGVISAHTPLTTASERIASRKSAGILCIALLSVFFWVIIFLPKIFQTFLSISLKSHVSRKCTNFEGKILKNDEGYLDNLKSFERFYTEI